MIAPEVSTFALHSALFVTFARSAEAGLEAPMGSEGNKSNGLLPPLSSQDLSDSGLEVVVTQSLKDAAEIPKRDIGRSAPVE